MVRFAFRPLLCPDVDSYIRSFVRRTLPKPPFFGKTDFKKTLYLSSAIIRLKYKRYANIMYQASRKEWFFVDGSLVLKCPEKIALGLKKRAVILFYSLDYSENRVTVTPEQINKHTLPDRPCVIVRSTEDKYRNGNASDMSMLRAAVDSDARLALDLLSESSDISMDGKRLALRLAIDTNDLAMLNWLWSDCQARLIYSPIDYLNWTIDHFATNAQRGCNDALFAAHLELFEFIIGALPSDDFHHSCFRLVERGCLCSRCILDNPHVFSFMLRHYRFPVKRLSWCGRKMLIWAIRNGRVEIANRLLDENDLAELEHEAISIASSCGQLEIVRRLLDNSSMAMICGQKLVKKAIVNRHLDIVELLLTHSRIDPNTFRVKEIVDELDGNLAPLVAYLDNPRVDYIANGAGDYLLQEAARHGNLEIVHRLLEDPRLSSRGQDLLLLAAEKGHLEIVNRLLQEDEHVDPSFSRNMAVVRASSRGHVAIVARLLEDERVRSSLYSRDQFDQLLWAISTKHIKIIPILADTKFVSQKGVDGLLEYFSNKRKVHVVFALVKTRPVDLGFLDPSFVKAIVRCPPKRVHYDCLELLLSKNLEFTNGFYEKKLTISDFAVATVKKLEHRTDQKLVLIGFCGLTRDEIHRLVTMIKIDYYPMAVAFRYAIYQPRLIDRLIARDPFVFVNYLLSCAASCKAQVTEL